MLDIGPRVVPKAPGEEQALAARRQTGFGEYMGAMAAEGWWNTLAGQARAQVRQAKGGEADPRKLSREDWQASEWQRDGLEWYEGLTAGQARARAEIFDENAYRRWVIGQRDAGAVGTAAGIGAMLVGSIPTPENLIPLGPAIHAAKAGRFGLATRQGAVAGGLAGLAGTAAFAPPVYYSASQFGDDIGWADVLLDLSLGTALGAGLGAGSAALAHWSARAPHQPTMTMPETQTALDALALAGQDLAANRPVDVAASADVRAAIRDAAAREEAASVRVTTRRPATLTSFLRSIGGLVDDAGELTSRDFHIMRPGLISRKGNKLDDATLMAWDAGYLGSTEGPRPTPDALLAAIDQELSGRPVFAAGELEQAMDFERQTQSARDLDHMNHLRDDARMRAEEMGYDLSPEQIDEALEAAAADPSRDIEDVMDDMIEREAMRMADEIDPAGRSDDAFDIPFEPLGEGARATGLGPGGPRAGTAGIGERAARERASGSEYASRSPADPDLEPLADLPANDAGLDAMDQETFDRFVAELEERGDIPEDIRAELEEAAAFEQRAARAREVHERAAYCALGG